MNRTLCSVFGECCLQDFHVAQAPEGSVHQAAEAVPLHLQGAESVQTVERQALHPADTVPAQLPETHTQNGKFQSTSVFSTCLFPLN